MCTGHSIGLTHILPEVAEQLDNLLGTSFVLPSQTYSNSAPSSPWPVWISRVTSVSHLLLALACSTNFFVYYAKHGQKRS